MMNQIILIGTVASFPVRGEDDYVRARFTIEVERPYRTPDGQTITDVFTVILWRGCAEIITQRHGIGEMVAVKGRLENNDGVVEILAERVSFISEKNAEA